MEASKDMNKEQSDNNVCAGTERTQLAQLYLSTAETLAQYAYEASTKQKQMNMLAQQITVNSVRDLYSIFTPEVR